ncbi:hypothetical protein ACVBEF_10075 [Glaciimonas sp. GG7]
MPNTNASPSSSPSENPAHEKLSDAIDREQQMLMMDCIERSDKFAGGLGVCLDIFEVNETYATNPDRNTPEADALAIDTNARIKLKAFALDAIALFGEHLIEATAALDEHSSTLRKARKAALKQATKGCEE